MFKSRNLEGTPIKTHPLDFYRFFNHTFVLFSIKNSQNSLVHMPPMDKGLHSGKLTWPWKIPIFPGTYQQYQGFAVAMLVYPNVKNTFSENILEGAKHRKEQSKVSKVQFKRQARWLNKHKCNQSHFQRHFSRVLIALLFRLLAGH